MYIILEILRKKKKKNKRIHQIQNPYLDSPLRTATKGSEMAFII
jgi:hypothetical protein